jgi:hypothetical protein
MFFCAFAVFFITVYSEEGRTEREKKPTAAGHSRGLVLTHGVPLTYCM